MKVTSTESQMLSSFNIHVFVFEKVGSARKKKGKDLHQLREGGKHRDNGKSGTSACYANFNFIEDYDHGGNTVEPADTHRTHSDPSDLWRRLQRSSRLRCLRERRHVSSICCSERRPHFRSGQARSLADMQDNDLDPEVGLQLEQAKTRAYLPFEEEKGKIKGKSKFLVRPSCSPLKNRRKRTEELKAKTERDVYGRK